MFTGIIEDTGKISGIRRIRGGIAIRISAKTLVPQLSVGDSISVNGVCQTVVRLNDREFTVEAVGETLEKTTLGHLSGDEPVNLELPVQASSRMGGHFVQGHVNATGRITRWFPRGDNYFLEVEVPAPLMRYIVLEGSIAIEGISLTVAQIKENRVGINIIPHTARVTNLRHKEEGDSVNLEVDMIAKYIEKLLSYQLKHKLSEE